MGDAYVGLLTYNTKDLVQENVAGLIASGLPAEALVVWDNGSTDGTADALPSEFPEVRVESSSNLGYAEGMNRLVSTMNAEHVILLTADCFTTGASIERLLRTLQSETGVAICGGRLISGSTGRIESEGGTVSFPLGLALAHNKHRSADTPTSPAFEVAYIDGAFLGLNTAAFTRIGGFDARYFAYHEEVDFCWRARLLGYGVVCDPAAVAIHRTYGSFGPFPAWRWRLMERNRIATNLKNLDTFHVTAAVLAEAGYAAALTLLTPFLGPDGYLKAYGKAISELASGRLELRAGRRRVQVSRRRPDAEVLRFHARVGPRALFSLLNVQRERFYAEDTEGGSSGRPD